MSTTITLSVSDDMKAFVEERLATGQFEDLADYLRELIRADEAHLEWLRAEVQEGFDSGLSPYTVDEALQAGFERAGRKCA